MVNFLSMPVDTALKELRCENDPQHRIEAAKFILASSDDSGRIAYLLNCVLYDPLPEVRNQIKALLFEVYGNELESILKVEGMDGSPIEEPWMVPCNIEKNYSKTKVIQPKFEDIESLIAEKDVAGLHDALRDPLNVEHRISAIQALLECNNAESPDMLARAILNDPDENVQQQAYQALYELTGNEEAETLLGKIGAPDVDEEEQWLLEPDYFEDYLYSEANNKQDVSPFGINKADQIRGLVNLYTNERNPNKRIKIINSLSQSQDFNNINIIARIGLFDSDNKVQDNAKSVLENRLGENLDEFLEHIYNTASPALIDPDVEEEEEELEELNRMEEHDSFSTRLNMQEPVVSEGNPINPIIIVAGLVILAMVLYFILR